MNVCVSIKLKEENANLRIWRTLYAVYRVYIDTLYFFPCQLENIEPYNCRKSEFDMIENVN